MSDMHKHVAYFAYGWLIATGVMHFVIDVVLQYLRRVRVPSAETTLYYGLNSSFSLGQVALGAFGLWLAWRTPELLREPPAVVISVLAAIGWFITAQFFMAYWQPKITVAVFGILVVAAAVIGRR